MNDENVLSCSEKELILLIIKELSEKYEHMSAV